MKSPKARVWVLGAGLMAGLMAGLLAASPEAAGSSCKDGDPDRICLALKYVVYQKTGGDSIVSELDAQTNLKSINELWSQCNIGFEIEEFVAVKPEKHRLRFNTSTMDELTSIRRAFQDESKLLVVTTGQWSGTLGAGKVNAWTANPGNDFYGVVMEASVARYPNIIAHELGHYLELPHVADRSDVMNPIIYQDSTKLTSDQCRISRNAVQAYWKNMRRTTESVRNKVEPTQNPRIDKEVNDGKDRKDSV